MLKGGSNTGTLMGKIALSSKKIIQSALVVAAVAFCASPATAGDPLDDMAAASHAPELQWKAKPSFHLKPQAPGEPQAAGGPHGYSPAQISQAYQFYALPAHGAGQKIAIIDAYGSPTIQNDLNVFCTQFGIAKTTVNIVYPQGKPGHVDDGWAMETSLDVEWAHATAPASQIILVVAKSDGFNDLLGAIDYAVALGANEVSMSWGSPEFNGETYYDSHFNKPGVWFTASAGDSGSGVMWPAVSPYVIGVGGTTLKLTAQGGVVSETAWDGSGGGYSAFEPRPGYQNGWNAKKGRGVPDVSYVADPETGLSVYISTGSPKGWVQVGGTSVGAPQWAALIAIANGFHTFAPGDSVVSSLYVVGGLDYAYFFRDVTKGNNGGFDALPKYDFVTGLGSPIADDLALYLGKY
ncbi:MAG TPA: S53 family peptidase [Chthoniobacteraceae bacterium]|nr:S53 family peptidase [Chthoniobacteraceae bacterium]